jgi:ketosteroid isomerase-like protein
MSELGETERHHAEQACQALATEYAEIVDTQDYARLREVFSNDAVFARPTNPDEPIRGIDNIIASFTSRPGNRVTQHFVCNVRVKVESEDAASGSCRILLYVADASDPETAEGRQTARKQLIGIYRDRFVRTKNGWRIAERRGHTLMHT